MIKRPECEYHHTVSLTLREYLTGFHKRKVQRQKKAQEYNQEQERLAKIEERRRIREERAKDLEAQLENFKKTTAELNIDGEEEPINQAQEEWTGFEDEPESDAEKPHGILKRIYAKNEDSTAPINDETTVTIESISNHDEPIDLHELAKRNYVDLSNSEKVLENSIKRANRYAVLSGEVERKPRKKKFRYLTKGERRNNNRKEKIKKRGKKDSLK